MRFIAAMAMALVPRRWWGRWEPDSTVTLRHAALAQGTLQCAAAGTALAWRYVLFFALRAHQLSAVADTNEGTQLYYTFIVTVEFLLVHPSSWLLEYLALEGFVRAVTVWTSGEVVSNWVLRLLAWMMASAGARRAETALGVRVADAVLPGDGQEVALRVATCRRKPWTASHSISYREELFELLGEEPGAPPRRFVYLLRKAPPHKIVRGLYHYDPEEDLEAK